MNILFVFSASRRNLIELQALSNKFQAYGIIFRYACLSKIKKPDYWKKTYGLNFDNLEKEHLQWADHIVCACGIVINRIKREYVMENVSPKIINLYTRETAHNYSALTKSAIENYIQKSSRIKFKAYSPIIRQFVDISSVHLNGTNIATCQGATWEHDELMEFTGITDINGKEYYTGMGGTHAKYGDYVIEKGNYQFENLMLSGYYINWLSDKAKLNNVRPDILFWVSKRLPEMKFDKNIFQHPELARAKRVEQKEAC